MIKKITSWNKLRYKYKIMIYIFTLVILAVLAFGFYNYHNYLSQLKERTSQSSEMKLEQIVGRIDERLLYIRRYYIAISRGTEVQYALDNKLSLSEYSKIKSAIDVLSGNNVLNDYLSEFTFINFRTNDVLSQKGMYQLPEAKNSEQVTKLFENGNSLLDRTFWLYDSKTPVLHADDINYRLTITTGGLSFCIKLPYANPTIYAMIIANVNGNELYAWMEEGLLDGEEFVVLDADGNCLFTSDTAFAEAYVNAKKLNNKNDTKLRTEEGTDYIISSKHSSVMDWEFCVGSNWDSIGKEAINFSFTLLALIFVVLIIAALLVVYAIYSPISNLTEKATKSSMYQQGEIRDELKFLENSFEHMVGSNALLEEKVKEQRQSVMELFELRLLRGELTEDEIDAYLDRFSIEPNDTFSTITIILRSPTENESLSSEKEAEICNEIVKNIPPELKKIISLQPVYYARAIFLVIREENKNIMLHLTMELFNGLQKYVKNTYGLNIIAGVSEQHNNFHELNQAYQESICALNNVEEETEGNSSENYSYYRLYTKRISKGKKKYDRSYEKEVCSAIMGCDREQTYEAVNHFFHSLKSKELSRDDTIIYLNQFINAIILSFQEFGLEPETMFEDGLTKIYMHVIQFYSLDECRKYIKSVLIDTAMRMQEAMNQERAGSIMENIQKLIEEKKGNITLGECADILNYHPTYIWKILKMEKGRSFSEYLEEYKLTLSKKLLLETDMTVNDIAAELNFTNAQNFIRFFNRAQGTTPGKFRKSSHEQ